MQTKNIRDWSLKHKLILHISVIGLLTAVLLTWIYFRTQKNIIRALSEGKARVASSSIARQIYPAMQNGNIDKVQSVLSEIVTSEDIHLVRFITPKGTILRSSQADEKGRIVDEATLHNLDEFLSENKSTFSSIKSKSIIQIFQSIENKKECFGCHSPSQKINGILEIRADYAEAAFLLRRSQIMGVIIAVLSLTILTFIILRLFNKLISRPLMQMKDKMAKVQSGDLTIQIHAMKNDEIGDLAASFNIMVQKLKAANEKIQDLFHKQMEKAEHLASLGEIAAGLAHEIVNPIAGIKGALEIISQKTEEADPKKEIFTEMLLQIDRIEHIIQDLLSYARPKEMKLARVNPNESVEAALKLARPQAKDKDIQFEFHGVHENIFVDIDQDKIQEVLLNMMLNSISAIEKRGIISIRANTQDEKELVISVSDDGSGIKKDNLPLIFNPFFTTKSRGTGLGLSICKKIIEAHNGSITVESEEKRGTTFVIRLPFAETRES